MLKIFDNNNGHNVVLSKHKDGKYYYGIYKNEEGIIYCHCDEINKETFERLIDLYKLSGYTLIGEERG